MNREDRDRRRQAEQDRRNAERSRRLNRRGQSPPRAYEDPYLSSAGDGPGCYCDDEER